MATKKKEQKKTKQKEDLDAAFFELHHLERYLDGCLDIGEGHVDESLAIFLVRAAQEKIRYFSRKYNFKVDLDDLFFIENYADFIRKSEGVPTKKERIAKLDERRAEA